MVHYLRLVKFQGTVVLLQNNYKIGGWKRPLDAMWSNSPAQAGTHKAGCPEAHLDDFSMSSRRETLQPLWAIYSCTA